VYPNKEADMIFIKEYYNYEIIHFSDCSNEPNYTSSPNRKLQYKGVHMIKKIADNVYRSSKTRGFKWVEAFDGQSKVLKITLFNGCPYINTWDISSVTHQSIQCLDTAEALQFDLVMDGELDPWLWYAEILLLGHYYIP
jgi:hypothetical protein